MKENKKGKEEKKNNQHDARNLFFFLFIFFTISFPLFDGVELRFSP